MNKTCKPILFANHSSLIFKNSKSEDLKNDIDIVTRWFEANKLSLNFDKNHYIKFTTQNSHQFDLVISYANKSILKELDIKFFGRHLDSALSWKIHM
jgi:hypothetical protein